MFLQHLFLFILFFVTLGLCHGYFIQDLGGSWTLKDTKNEYDLQATIPGGIYTDLMNNDVIGDIFYGFRDVETRWVSLKNWTYTKIITVDEELLWYKNQKLVLNGIDTFATISINDIDIGSTDNMFCRYDFDLTGHLKVGENTISVKFQSPVEIAKKLFEKQSGEYEVPPKCVPDEYNGECHANHVRKMQASFSWDWGPAFPSVGIWKPIYLEAYNYSVIRDITVNISSNVDTWDLEIHVYFAEIDVLKGTILTTLYTDVATIENVFSVELIKDEDDELVGVYHVSVPKLYVKLWWPNGYGNANLYKLKVSYVSDDETEASIKSVKIGFRTIKLMQNTYEEFGRTFYFVVNGVPIFAKGTNSIPINILPELGQNKTTIRYLLQSAKDVHMNMIRVWGGGVYESDYFYNVADELGILIWQDFMFACSMYPTNEDFLNTVKKEVKHQVRRLQHHASIAIWAANNENEAALRQNWYGTKNNFEQYQIDFVKLYVDTIREETFKSDTSRDFLTSSPTNGIESEIEGYVAINPQSKLYGDVHYYNYVQDAWNHNIYPITRFASEYGYQSLPSISTLLTATNNTKDLKFGTDFLIHRQHHLGGYDEMKLLIDDRLNLPSEESEHFFEAFVFYSQILQAMAVKIETEYYRLWRSNVNSVGEGLTMGALYWQLNDVWVAPTWAGIDFKNNWKMLHYYAKDFFAPIIITGYLDSARNFKLFTVSDLTTAVYNVTAVISVYKWDSFVPIYNDTYVHHLLPGVSNKISSVWIDKLLSEVNCGTLITSQHNCFLQLTLVDDKNNKIAPDNYIFPSPLNSVNLTRTIVQILSVEQIDEDGKVFNLEISADCVSLFVWLDSGSIRGRFSDNGFIQVTNTRIVQFTAEGFTTATDLKENLGVTHLLDSQYF